MDKRQTKPSFRKAIKERCGEKCYICGRSPVEYHHLIPLWAGGEEVISNYIALCRPHHLAMHGIFGEKRLAHSGGRPKEIAPEGYESVLDGYFNCQYGKHRCDELLPITGGRKLQDKWWYKEYILDRGIKKHRNNIDLLYVKNNGNVENITNKMVGYILYTDGTKEVFYSKDVEEWQAENV